MTITEAYRDGLAHVFGAEWRNLDGADQLLILRDCAEDGGVADLAEYRRNIGRGNLQAYADVMRVRFARDDRRFNDRALSFIERHAR